MDKNTILFIPGMACTSQIWEGLELLPHYFDCVFTDWPTDKMSTWKTLEDCTEWVIEQVKDSGASIVIGHSLGGLALLKALEQGAIQLDKAIVIESFLSAPSDFFKQFVGPYASEELEENLHAMFNKNRNHFSEDFREFIRHQITTKCVDLKKIHNTFFIYGMRGEEDGDKVLEMLPYLQHLNDSNSIGLMPYSGHFPMIEEPQELEEAINEFID